MLAVLWVGWLTVTLPASVAAVLLLFALARAIGKSLGSALFTVIIAVFGTNLLFLGSQLNNNVAIAAIALFAALLFLRVIREKRHLSVGEFVGLTSAMGLGILIDLGTLPVVVVALPAIWLLRPDVSPLHLVFLSLPALVPIGALLVYQGAVFGQPFMPPQFHIPPSSLPVHQEHLSLKRAFDLLIGPQESVLAFTPVAFLGAGLLLMKRRMADLVPYPWRLGVLSFLLLELVFIWVLPICQCSYGPRYLLPAILVAVSAIAAIPLGRWTSPLLGVVAFSTVVNVAGVSQGIMSSSVPFSLALFVEGGLWLPLLDVIRDIAPRFGYSPTRIGPSGLLFACFALLAAIWLPVVLEETGLRVRRAP